MPIAVTSGTFDHTHLQDLTKHLPNASMQSFVFNVLKQDIKRPFLVHYTTVNRAAYESSVNYALVLEINCVISKH